MFRKLLAAVGLDGPDDKAEERPQATGEQRSGTSAGAPVRHQPYTSAAANDVYNLLFCDDASGWRAREGQTPTPWQRIVFATSPSIAELRALAGDPAQEGRVRYLAFARLRALGETVPAKLLLGVIVEVGLDGGLDVLATFDQGGVRYINQTGKVAVFEGVPQLEPLAAALRAASQPVVERIGPWDQPRRAAPGRDAIRMSFLVSDGLYFGEGPMATMQRDSMAGPIIQRATELLQAVVRTAAP